MSKLLEERFPIKVYVLNGITYVPHYRNDSVYVGPAYDWNQTGYSPEYLQRQGASTGTLYLWKRGTTGKIPNVMT
jgi:hypothetical protein